MALKSNLLLENFKNAKFEFKYFLGLVLRTEFGEL